MKLKFARMVFLASLAGCSNDGLTTNGFRCSTAGACPSGFTCLEGLCWKGGVRPDAQAAQEGADAAPSIGDRDAGAGLGDSRAAPSADLALPDGTTADARAEATVDVAVDAPGRVPDGPPGADISAPIPDALLPSPDVLTPPDVGPAGAPNGSPCTRRQDCASGSCAPDGTCCDNDCQAACEACNIAGSVGRCTRVTSGQPHGKPACAGSGECAGSCTGASPACVFPTSACGTASCSGNVLTKPGTCNGSGTCSSGGTQDCGGFRCAGTTCKTTCASEGDCAAGHYCAGASGCLPTKSMGAGCTDATQCMSGFCRDQVCCNEACSGVCKTCSAGGICTTVVNNVDPDSCQTTRFCGSAAYSGTCILGLVLNKNGGFVPDAFYTFAPRAIGDEAIETFYLTRGPGVAMMVNTVSLVGMDTDQFTLMGDACSYGQLSPGLQCELQIRFAPTRSGTNFSAIIEAVDGQGNKARMAVGGRTP